MRWKRVQGQGDMEDRRGQGGGGLGGGGLPIPMGKGAGGLGIILAIVVALLFGGNIVGGGSDSGFSPGRRAAARTARRPGPGTGLG